MLWETLWVLIVGFTLSGVVQTFVSKDQMQSRLGGHRPRTVARAAGYGLVSSSCSNAASAMSKSLFARGADFTSAMPLILIYRKFYGGTLTLRIVGMFCAVMVVAGLVTEVLCRSTGLVPTSRILHVGAERLTWNYTTYLNIAAFVVAAAVWSLARHGRHRGEASGYAIDPVCQMQVRIADAPARASVHGQTYCFCSDRCRERFSHTKPAVTIRCRS
jgi:hypothetical protein